MKKTYLTLIASMVLATNANAFVVSPHVGIDYVSSTPNGYGNIDSLNGASLNAGVKALGFLSVEGYYQKYFSTSTPNGSKTKPAAYGLDLVADTLNLGVVEVLTTVGYGKYTLDGGTLGKKLEKFEDTSYRAGFGVQVNPTDNIGIRAMYRYVFPKDDFFKKNVQELSIGLRYYFF
ncbi:MAG: outer membrane beta-barrel protein [Alphaproteobacteria bacterium]|nr:outer membrane beta-barrel protein [Alphaproteobacteria bacterium]